MSAPHASRWLAFVWAAVSVAAPGCYYRPALFADREIADAVRDDLPIAVPSRRAFDVGARTAIRPA